MHYQEIRKARKQHGLPVNNLQHDLSNHAFSNKTVLRNGKMYVVERVFKEWCLGWYIVALIREIESGSHVCVNIENINSAFVKTGFENLVLVSIN